MAGVQLVDIEKTYAAVTAVPRLDLTIEDGGFLVLPDPSGCGRTTTMRMIAGLEEITSGHIMIAGGRIDDKPPEARDIAMMFRNCGLCPHMTVRQNIDDPFDLRGADRTTRTRRVQETAGKVGLDALLAGAPPNSRTGSGSGWRWPG